MRKFAAPLLAFTFALTACGGGDSADVGGGDSDTRSQGVWGTDIKFSEVDGAAITQFTTAISMADAQVIDVAGEQELHINITISHDEAEPVKFPAIMFICHANEDGSTLEPGRMLTGGTSHVQPDDVFTDVLSFEVPTDSELGEGCMEDAYIDVRYDASLGGASNLFNESLTTGVFRLDAATIAAIN